MIDRTAAALRAAGIPFVVIANDPTGYEELGVEVRPDVGIESTGSAESTGRTEAANPTPPLERGALLGVHSALHWAREGGASAALILACDLPLLPASLLQALAAGASEEDVLVPESPGPLGFEPLVAAWGVGCIRSVASALAAGDPSLHRMLERVPVRRIPLDEVGRHGDPETILLNMNRPADRDRAELVSGGRQRSGRSPDDAVGGPMMWWKIR